MIRNNAKELEPKLYKLKKDLKKLDLIIAPTKQNEKYWTITHSLIEGFNIVNEQSDDWSQIIASSTVNVFKFMNSVELLDINKSLITSIKKECKDIFYTVYKRSIEDENKMSDLISYLNKIREKNIHVIIVCMILSFIISLLYSIGYWCCYKQPLFSWDGPWYAVTIPFFVFMFMGLLLSDVIRGWVSKSIKITMIFWKIHWGIPSLLSRIKYWFNKIR